MYGVNPDFDYLYDEQQARPSGMCINCGKEIYKRDSDLCARCEDHENNLEE